MDEHGFSKEKKNATLHSANPLVIADYVGFSRQIKSQNYSYYISKFCRKNQFQKVYNRSAGQKQTNSLFLKKFN